MLDSTIQISIISILLTKEENETNVIKDRNMYIRSYQVLRTLLGKYFDSDPRDLLFESSDYGKPILAQPQHAPRKDFNLSHSRDLPLSAMSASGHTVISVEEVFRLPDP
jgi:phosphopantetheinyl transferase